ncbi:MAG: SLBB domain-containing protein, partial [Pseudomonadota bacterium]
MKSHSRNRIQKSADRNTTLTIAVMLLIAFSPAFSVISRAQDRSTLNRSTLGSSFSEQEISDFLQLDPSSRQNIIERMSPFQQGLLESELGKRGKSVTAKDKAVSPRKGVGELKKEEGIGKEEVPEIIPPKSLFDRYRPTERYQEISIDLKPFGYAFFQEYSVDVDVSEPSTGIPVSSDYMIGPGDEVVLTLWGRMSGRYYLTVERDGTIAVPNIGPIKVGGMQFDQMKRHIKNEVQKIFGAKANVSMGGLKTIKVFVLGEVKKPGMYPIDSLSTIMNALVAAGGPNDIGSLRKIKLNRNNKTITVMDFYDLLIKGDKSQDRVLISGDLVFVPTVGPLVGVAGNVKRPAIYELKDKPDLLSVLDLAGGIIPTAYTQQIQVERIKRNEREVVIDLNAEDHNRAKSFFLQDGDLVKIFSIVEKIENVVTLSGNVKKPGKYEYKPGMKISDVIKNKSDLLKETYFKYAVIKRRLPPNHNVELFSFNLEKALQENNIALRPQDEIRIFSEWAFKSRPFVTVHGEVRKLEAYNELRALIVPYREIREKANELKAKGQKVPLEMEMKIEKIEREIETRFPYSTVQLQYQLQAAEERSRELKAKGEDVPLRLEIEIENVKKEVEGKKLYAALISAKSKLERLKFGEKKAESKETRDEIRQEIDRLKEEIQTRTAESDTIIKLRLEELKSRISEMAANDGNGSLKAEFDLEPETETKQAVELDHLKVTIFENSRLKDALLAAGGFTENAYLKKGEIIRTNEKGERSQISFNVEKALAGNPEENVLLQDKDKVIIHSKWETQYKQTVSIRGEVTNPGTYPYTKDMRISDLVFTAGNLLESAYLDEAEISTFISIGQENINIMRRTVNIKRALMGDPEHNLAISANSELVIKAIPDWGERVYANITGEVRFPGRYNIGRGEKFSSLIERAGGFTSEAYLR